MFHIVKRVINWCGKYKARLYMGIFLTFFVYVCNAAPIVICCYMLNHYVVFESISHTFIFSGFIAIAVCILLKFIFVYLKAYLQEPIGYLMVAKNRMEVGEALKRVSLGYFSEMNTGLILNSITTGFSVMEKMGIRTIDTYVSGYMNFLVIFIYFCFVDFKLACISCIFAFLSLFFLIKISKSSMENAQILNQSNEDLTKATLEYARGLSMVKSFGQKGASYKKMKEAIESSKAIHLKTEWSYVPYNALHLMALKFGSILFAFVAFNTFIQGDMDFQEVLTFVTFSFLIFSTIEPISESSHVLTVMNEALNQMERLKNERCMDENGKDIELSHYDIQFKHVDFQYTTRKVLDDVSFVIPEHTTTAIVGPSGSGKTTICNLIARFYDVKNGEICIGNKNVKEFTFDSLLKNISMVFQNVYLFNDTIRANICFGKTDATEKEMIEASKKACCHDFIMQLPQGYDTIVGEQGGRLSGGEKQRISIARAILKDAPIIILDEATASVDPENEQYIQKAIQELTRNKTIISIAHRIATIENADQILVVNHGKIVQKGKHDELIHQEGKYLQFMKARKEAEGWNILQ